MNVPLPKFLYKLFIKTCNIAGNSLHFNVYIGCQVVAHLADLCLCSEYFHWLMKLTLFITAICCYYPDYYYSLANEIDSHQQKLDLLMEHTGNIKIEAKNRNYQNKQKLLQ
jgi:hypothetical protein